MIKRTRQKLLFIYSGIIALILVIMAASFYFILSGVVNRDEHSRLEKAAEKTVQEWLHHTTGIGKREIDDHRRPGGMEWEFLQNDQFAVVHDGQGKIISTSGVRNPLVDDDISQQLVMGGESSSYMHIEQQVSEGRKVYAVYRVAANDGKGSVIYIGEDISKQLNLLSEMKWLLSGLTIVLLLIASVTGYIFAGRAMVPIVRSLKRQQEFTADASHELRTPLSVLQSSVEILEEQKGKLPDVHQTVLYHMKDEIVRMIRLTEQLLMLARADSGLLQIRQESFDLREMVYAVTERMKTIAKEHRVEICVEDMLPEGKLLYTGDPDQINQLLYILLDNAIKYSVPGTAVTVRVGKYGEMELDISIEDKGCGIPRESLPHLFERFYRVDKGRSRQWGGTGLGLSIAAQITRNHGGQIFVTSEINQGSTFIVRLPDR
ncbi:ATP-binding protein [Paenibacillus terrigena]|uniref:sensor histidine kinase n=1 Tax=Paenibacillus terrigena TaxID=369333 RepID=UPI0028D2906A|nr:ATP-binding protein [Paenibacillus terrigena]